jgi:two-component system cell cycle response regulator
VSPPKVLIADDSPLVLRMIQKMLEGAGLAVVTAKDGLEAVEKAFGEDVSLVILDVVMPRMNGYQACRLLKTEPATKDLPVVILTSKDQAGDRFWGLETGADYYMTKDADPQRILDLVRNVLAGEAGARRERGSEAQRTSVDILSRVNDLLDRKLFEATILSEIGQVARSLVHFDETFSSVMAIVARVVDYSVGVLAFVESEELDAVFLVRRPLGTGVLDEARAKVLEAVVAGRGGQPVSRVKTRELTAATPDGAPKPSPPEPALAGFAAFPVVTGGRLSGLLAVGGRAASRISRDTEAFLGQVANQAAIVVENSRLFERVRNLSIRDGLTELLNHRHSLELLEREFQRVGRYEGGVGLLMIDIDHFKKVNDAHGHPVGDAVLREVAGLLRETLRAVDALGRYGGEEFIVILPHTRREETLATAERLRRAVAEHLFRVAGRELRVTVSVGVATFPSDRVDSPASLVREADQALYRAKQAGRNRVM